MASSLSKYPHPIYMDYDTSLLPRLDNYSVKFWKVCMLRYLVANGLISFVDGSIQPPPSIIKDENDTKEIANPDYEEWKKIDDNVQATIMSTITDDFKKEISSSITKTKTAKDLWDLILNSDQRPWMTHADRVSNKEENRPNFTLYLPLYEAAIKGDMKVLDEILKKEPTALRALITGSSETALMVASARKGSKNVVKKLISLMSPEDLAMQDSFGMTALSAATLVGDVEIVKLMVEKNSRLPNICDMYNQPPIELAAFYGKKDLVLYLLPFINEESFQDIQGQFLVYTLILGRFFDICLTLLRRFPKLALVDISPLTYLTDSHSAFLSGANFSSWQRFIYSYLPSDLPNAKIESGDVENPWQEVIKGFNTNTKRSLLFWKHAGKLVPKVKHVQEQKVMHTQARQLVRFICLEIAKLDGKSARDLIGYPLASAASIGNVEVVEEILKVFPNAIYLQSRMNRGVFHIAIKCRQAKVFSLIYQMTTLRPFVLAQLDTSFNTALHLAAHLVGETETEADLNLRSSGPGPALQMQRELQWFKEVEKLSWPQDKEKRNIDDKTPAVIFNETHEKLAKEAEQWMKDRANYGLVVATLIATIVFQSSITVPGGTDSVTGLPTFLQKQAFLVFAISDALALFMSVSSMLMFLGILTARYAIEDFLYSLPKRLIIALITLFLSIICMMIAFTAILYLLFGHEKRWVLGIVSASAAIPVLLFAFLQFKPLFDIIRSTYRPQIFGKQSDYIIF